jgi:8-oxo-dGTP pyrophosphatase MutT (NUDIX family)
LYFSHAFGTFLSHSSGQEAAMARVRRQAAVIPYRIRRSRLEVALVTRSKGKGWIVPKGAIDEGERARDAAIREAEEEAGLRGIVARRRLGRYWHQNGHGPCLVDVYLMRVTTVMEEWMEDSLRRRRWMRVPDAADHLQEELHGFIHDLNRSLRSVRLER